MQGSISSEGLVSKLTLRHIPSSTFGRGRGRPAAVLLFQIKTRLAKYIWTQKKEKDKTFMPLRSEH